MRKIETNLYDIILNNESCNYWVSVNRRGIIKVILDLSITQYKKVIQNNYRG